MSNPAASMFDPQEGNTRKVLAFQPRHWTVAPVTRNLVAITHRSALCWKTVEKPYVASPHMTTQSGRKWYYQGGLGSVRFGYGSGVERFEWFRFSVPAVPLQNGFFFVFSTVSQERTVPVSVPGKRFRRFRFRFRFREKRFRRFRFPVPVRFLSHPVLFLRFRTRLRACT